MNTFLKTTAVSGLLLIGMVACKKDETRVVAEFGPGPVLTASTASVGALSLATAANTAITFNWTPYGIASISEGTKPVSPAVYTLQIDKASGNFSGAKQFAAGTAAEGKISRAITVSDLNAALLELQLPFNAPAQVKVRLKTTIADNQSALFSEAKTFTVSPYDACVAPGNLDWGLVGPAADGWPGPPTTDRNMPYVCGTTNAFTLLGTSMTAGEFKVRSNRAWTNNLGAATSAVTPVVLGTPIPLSQGGGNLRMPTAGSYNVKLVVTLDAAGVATGGTLTVTP